MATMGNSSAVLAVLQAQRALRPCHLRHTPRRWTGEAAAGNHSVTTPMVREPRRPQGRGTLRTPACQPRSREDLGQGRGLGPTQEDGSKGSRQPRV